MIKMLYSMRRLPGISQEEFETYWREKHTPVASRLAPALGLKKYVQTWTLDVPFNEMLMRSRSLGERFDGAGELWWSNVDEMIDALSGDAGFEANLEMLDDEANFIDFANSCAWICEDHVVYEADQP